MYIFAYKTVAVNPKVSFCVIRIKNRMLRRITRPKRYDANKGVEKTT
jgi:uncharacterized pyridoxamine 5'-phosphate oxidase family protein